MCQQAPATAGLTPLLRGCAQAASLAASGEAAGAALAAVLRAKASSQLSKDALLQLCALWGYAHHAFRRKGDGARKRKRQRPRRADAFAAAALAAAAAGASGVVPTTAAADASTALAQPRASVDSVLLCAFDAASVAQFAAGALSAVTVASCGALEGHRAAAAVTTHRTPHCLAKALCRYDDISAACNAAARRLAQLQQAQGPWVCKVLEHARDGGGAAALWLALPLLADEAPAEAALALLRSGFTGAVRLHSGVVSDLELSSKQAPPGDPRHVMSLACAEFLDGITAGLRFIAAAEAALAAARAAADVADYCALCSALLGACERMCADLGAAFAARATWSRRVLEPGFCLVEPLMAPPTVEKRLDTFCAVVFAGIEATWRDGLAADAHSDAGADAGATLQPVLAA